MGLSAVDCAKTGVATLRTKLMAETANSKFDFLIPHSHLYIYVTCTRIFIACTRMFITHCYMVDKTLYLRVSEKTEIIKFVAVGQQ
jgi:hypothetical protein